MKVTGKNGPKGVPGVAAYTSVQRASKAAAASPVTPVADVSSILGIPDAEFTPRVRDAIMSLMAEVDSLRQDLERTRARLENVETMADQDGLLPILNRRAFVREMSRAISYAERYDTPASLIYFDLDGFKAINDAHGHAAGDAALRYVATFLTTNVRESDIVGRLGGDEFGVILAKADDPQCKKKAQSLADQFLAEPFTWEAKPLALSFAYGTHTFQKGETPDTAMATADKAMYAAKRGATGHLPPSARKPTADR
jgi:diguanylate cyclase (GGDEF)-like protein